ncbi:hypothetical protein [Geotalea uraniireducens]|uniref:hypothetical protein n=1 Tax=Geotalea uraniireducens TaxID=351604 RepID=UPI002492A6DE|nr:hypothetical protein [Geotalea uraniireducens]
MVIARAVGRNVGCRQWPDGQPAIANLYTVYTLLQLLSLRQGQKTGGNKPKHLFILAVIFFLGKLGINCKSSLGADLVKIYFVGK